MKSILIWLPLSFLLCAIAFSGCSKKSSRDNGRTVEIVFKHSKVPGTTYLTDIVRSFERENPGIRVREEILPSNSDDQHQFYAINLPAGASDFDILDMDVIWVPEFARAGWLQELTPEIDSKELMQLNPSALRADWYDGKLYGVPWYVDTGVLYYRTDLLDKYALQPPQTYEELLRASQTILAGEKDPRLTGFLWQGLQYEGLVCVALEFIRGNGGNVLGPDGRAALTQPAALQALEFLKDLIWKYKISPASVTTLNEEAARNLFQSGRAVFMRNWPYAWTILNRPGSPVDGRVGVSTVPHFASHESAPTLGGYHLGINAHSLHKKEAAAFLRFMIRRQTQKQVALQLGFLPANAEVYTDPEVQQKIPILPRILTSLRQVRARPVTPYYLMISQILQPEFSSLIAGIRSPRQAMASADQQIDHLMRGQ